MEAKKSNKIIDIVRLQQLIKKWKNLATKNTNKTNKKRSSNITSDTTTTTNKSIKFMKRSLSFTDIVMNVTNNNDHVVPKGHLAICVGRELKRYIIPTHYLGHQAFQVLLGQAEEEFGFKQDGVLKIPCEVSVFEKILKVVEDKKDVKKNHHLHHRLFGFDNFELITPHVATLICR